MIPQYGQQPPYTYVLPPPGTLTGAAILGYIDGGITLVLGGFVGVALMMFADDPHTNYAAIAVVLLAQVVGAVLLFVGGIQLQVARGRGVYMVGCVLEICVCLGWIIVLPDLVVLAAAGFGAIMPALGLILAFGGRTSRYLHAFRGHRGNR